MCVAAVQESAAAAAISLPVFFCWCPCCQFCSWFKRILLCLCVGCSSDANAFAAAAAHLPILLNWHSCTMVVHGTAIAAHSTG